MATKKIKDGLLVEYLSNGEVESKENYKNGKLDGESIYWHENGQKHAEQHFKNGKLDGKSIYWHENGQKSSEALYKNGLKEGVSTWYESDQINRTTNYKGGKEHGMTTFWHTNGQKKAQMDFKGDHIKTSQWYENGNIAFTGSTLNKKKENEKWSDKRIGECKWWDENGDLSEVANYKNSVLHGHNSFYNNKGQITLFKNYDNGSLLNDNDNEFIDPYRDGNIIEAALFLLKGLPIQNFIKDGKDIVNYPSIDVHSDAGRALRALLSYLESQLLDNYLSSYYGEDGEYTGPDGDLNEKAKNEVEAFIKILQYRLYKNPKLKHTDLLHNISFTDEELGIGHHHN